LLAAGADTHRARSGIDAHAGHQGEVDHETIVADPQTSTIVATAANGDEQVVLATETDSRDHIRYIRTTCDQAGVAVNHGIVDLASGVIALIVRLDEFPP
jgi:hypothetical protein